MGQEMYFDPNGPKDDRNALLGMYHHMTLPEQKETAEKAFTNDDSIMRVLFCTSSFSMGIDVKCCYNVIHLGPPKLIDEYLQQSGRCGRDGKPSYAQLLLFKGCTTGGGFDVDMKGYMNNSEVCRRVILLTAIQNPRIASLEIGHSCCDVCAKRCRCLCSCSEECECEEKCIGPHMYLTEAEKALNSKSTIKAISDLEIAFKDITESDRQLFQHELVEMKKSLVNPLEEKDMLVDAGIVTGFSTQLVDSLVSNMEYIASLDILMDYFPFFDEQHAVQVFDKVNAMFSHKFSLLTENSGDESECIEGIVSSEGDISEDDVELFDDLECGYNYSKPVLGHRDALAEASDSSSQDSDE